MSWTPATYNADTLPSRQRSGCPYIEHRCECGAWVRAERLIDVGALSIPQDYACDGCWTDWQRRGVPINGEARPDNRKAWLINWLSALGAPVEVIAKAQTVRTPDEYGRLIGARRA